MNSNEDDKSNDLLLLLLLLLLTTNMIEAVTANPTVHLQTKVNNETEDNANISSSYFQITQ